MEVGLEVGLELGRSWKSFKIHNRKSLDTYEQTVARNMDIKGDSGRSRKRGTYY